MLRSQATYYVISSSSDTPLSVEAMDAEELASRLENDHWGQNPAIYSDIPDINEGYIATDGNRTDLFIIKGTIVMPKAVETAIRYEVP